MVAASRRHFVKEAARFVEPMKSLPVASLPEGLDWEYESKFDGYCALAIKTGGA
jgi:ATP-dependent DNA ligase